MFHKKITVFSFDLKMKARLRELLIQSSAPAVKALYSSGRYDWNTMLSAKGSKPNKMCLAFSKCRKKQYLKLIVYYIINLHYIFMKFIYLEVIHFKWFVIKYFPCEFESILETNYTYIKQSAEPLSKHS